ncbi:MAG TPA: hypothetical protein VH206_06340 [Xanthobacteraceae bacterium]|jgi:hypothetical protein|nr:hypothetical protein [Xanthobacteraceae bacterium]
MAFVFAVEEGGNHIPFPAQVQPQQDVVMAIKNRNLIWGCHYDPASYKPARPGPTAGVPFDCEDHLYIIAELNECGAFVLPTWTAYKSVSLTGLIASGFRQPNATFAAAKSFEAWSALCRRACQMH